MVYYKKNFLCAILTAITISSSILCENPFDEVKIDASFSSLYIPKVHTSEENILPYSLKNTHGATINFDLPIWQYLHSGFLLRYLVSPKVGDIGGIIDLAATLKPVFGLNTKIGDFGAFLQLASGFSVTFIPVVNKGFEVGPDGMPGRFINVFGGLVNASAKAGFEYFPHPQFGLFAQAGFGYWYFLHQTNKKLFSPAFEFFTYHLTGVMTDFGVKFIF